MEKSLFDNYYSKELFGKNYFLIRILRGSLRRSGILVWFQSFKRCLLVEKENILIISEVMKQYFVYAIKINIIIEGQIDFVGFQMGFLEGYGIRDLYF